MGLKTVIGAIQRLLFERFPEEENGETYNPVVLLNLVRICNREILDRPCIAGPCTLTLLERYASYEDKCTINILEQHDFVILPMLLRLFSFGKLGDECSEDQEVTDEFEAFTCLIYGYAREKSVNTVRNIILSKVLGENDELITKSKVDLSRLLSCRDTLALHFANYGIVNYKCVHSEDNLFEPQSLVGSWPRLENDRGDALERVWS